MARPEEELQKSLSRHRAPFTFPSVFGDPWMKMNRLRRLDDS